MMFTQHLDGDFYRFSYSELESVEIFGKKIQDGGDIRVSCENWFLVSNFQKLRFFKNFFYVLFILQIQTNHGRTFF
jgi:hypothetical protein